MTPGTNHVRRVFGVLLASAAAAVALGAEPPTLSPQENWSNVFANRPVTLHYRVESQAAFQGRVGWTLSAEQRVLARGETALTLDAGGAADVAVRPQIPPVREGVVLAASLAVEAYGLQGGSLARHRRALWIFAENPFAGRTDWLTRRTLTVFDPAGTTAARLESAGVPLRHEKRHAAVADLREGILLVGEGVSWTRQPGLGCAMMESARRGVPVVCLAPADGVMPFPAASADASLPAEVVLRHEEAILRLDKRLDCRHWPPDGQSVAARFVIQAEKDRVVAAVAGGHSGWEWMEARYPAPGARLVVCGFGIVSHWDATPAPRYLLARLLEYVGDETDRTP